MDEHDAAFLGLGIGWRDGREGPLLDRAASIDARQYAGGCARLTAGEVAATGGVARLAGGEVTATGGDARLVGGQSTSEPDGEVLKAARQALDNLRLAREAYEEQRLERLERSDQETPPVSCVIAGQTPREIEEKRLVDEKVPCSHCGAQLVTDVNHRVLMGRGVLRIGRTIEVQVWSPTGKDQEAVFDGCIECFTRPALHWGSMIERVFELEASKVQAETRVNHLSDRLKEFEGRVTDSLGTLQLRWVTVGLGLACYEVLRLLVSHVLSR